MDGPPATQSLWHCFIPPGTAERNDGKRNWPQFCDFIVGSFQILWGGKKVRIVVTYAEMQVRTPHSSQFR
jgi:hypothetical protein